MSRENCNNCGKFIKSKNECAAKKICDCLKMQYWEPIKNNNEIYQQAINHYGIDNQISKAIEEMSELIKELSKYQQGIGDLEHIKEERDDVTIMMIQLGLIFGDGDYIEQKTERLKKRMEGKI